MDAEYLRRIVTNEFYQFPVLTQKKLEQKQIERKNHVGRLQKTEKQRSKTRRDIKRPTQ